MLKAKTINFSLDETNVIEQFEADELTNQDFEYLIINDAKSAQNGLELISQEWFMAKYCKQKNLMGIIFKIDEKVDEEFNEKPHYFKFKLIDSILISFQSTIDIGGSKTFWKFTGRDDFYSLLIDDDPTGGITSFCHDYILNNMKNGGSGLMQQYENKNVVNIREIGNNSGCNLLHIAATENKLDVINELLRTNFYVDDEDENRNMPIDYAWMNFDQREDEMRRENGNKMILELLKENSSLPYPGCGYDFAKASNVLKEFIRMCEILHTDVDRNDIDSLKNKLDENPNLLHFYDRGNNSLMSHMLKSRKYDMFKLFNSRIQIGSHENLGEVYEYAKADGHGITIKIQHQIDAKELPERHLLILSSKIKVGINDRHFSKRQKIINEALSTLNKNSLCSKILKIAAEIKKLKIYFDFKNETVFYLNPTRARTVLATIYKTESIHIGAKHLLDAEKKYEVYGAIAHELCHLAILLGYANPNFDPFPMGESDIKRNFIDSVMPQCKLNQEGDEIVANVFGYEKSIQASEMIVTVPQMMMEYCRNPEKLKLLEGIFPELFKYSREIVEPELDRALPVLKILGDENRLINFDELTEPMKAKILYTELKFQGAVTSFFDTIGNDDKILKLLTSETIRKILIKTEILEIGEICELTLKYGIIERNFVNRKIVKELMEKIEPKKYSSEIIKHTKNFQEIVNQERDVKAFVVADFAGAGKTTIFKDITRKLKSKYKNFWVSFINLRKHGEVFMKFKDQVENFSIAEVTQIFLEILNPKSEIESKIFEKLFSQKQVILLLDGFDEISPKFTDLLIKILKILKEQEIQLWISTRPHYSDQLEDVLSTDSLQFSSLQRNDIYNFVQKIVESHETNTYNIQSRASKVLDFLNANRRLRDQMSEVNPLLIEITAELHIERKINDSNLNQYEMYSAMVEYQKNRLGIKVPTEERDRRTKFSIWDVHYALAFKVIISDDYEETLGFKLEDLSIMKKWKREKKNWTSDNIQRYGLAVAIFEDSDDRYSIDFTHRTFAEFLIAQFFIDFLFDDHTGTSFDQIEKNVKIFHELIMKGIENFEFISDIFHSFMESSKCNQTQCLDEDVRGYIVDEIIPEIHENFNQCAIFNYNDTIFKVFKNYIYFLYNYQDMMNLIWGINNGITVIKNLLLKVKSRNFEKILFLAEKSFGICWHEIFNKSSEKLITNEVIDKFKYDDYAKNEKSLLKICDFVDKNFELIDKKIFFEKLNLYKIKNDEILFRIVNVLENVLNLQDFLSKCFTELNPEALSCKLLELFFEKITIFCEKNTEEIKKVLFSESQLCKSQPLLINAIQSNKLDVFLKTKEFYKDYINSWSDLQDIILNCNTHILIMHHVRCLLYSELEKLYTDIFGTDLSKIAEKFEIFFNLDVSYIFHEKNYANCKKYLTFVCSGDTEKVSRMLKNSIVEDITFYGLINFDTNKKVENNSESSNQSSVPSGIDQIMGFLN